MPDRLPIYLRHRSDRRVLEDEDFGHWLHAQGYNTSDIRYMDERDEPAPDLDAARRMRLLGLEVDVYYGLHAYVRVGTALRAIRDEDLYRLRGNGTFDAYVEAVWDMSPSHAYRLIDAATVYEMLSPHFGEDAPRNEAQCRALAPLLRIGRTDGQVEEPEEVAERICDVWGEVLAWHGRPTARRVREVLVLRAYTERTEPVEPLLYEPSAQVEVLVGKLQRAVSEELEEPGDYELEIQLISGETVMWTTRQAYAVEGLAGGANQSQAQGEDHMKSARAAVTAGRVTTRSVTS